MTRTFLLLFAFGFAAVSVQAQGVPETEAPETDVTEELGEADATLDAPATDGDRAEYAAAVEAAEASTALGTAEGHAEGGQQYLAAAAIAEASSDAELTALTTNAYEAAVRAFVDAASAHAGQQQFAEAAAQFEAAAAAAGQAGNTSLQARVTYNAGTAYVQAENPQRAVELFDEAIALDEGNLDYIYVRAVALRATGDTEGALAAFAQLAEDAEAAGDAENLTKANDAAGLMYLGQARDAIQAQDFRAAISALDEAARFVAEDDARLNAFYANAYYRQGVNHVRSEQWGPARTALQQAQRYARVAGNDNIVQGAQQQLDYIAQIQG